METSEQRCARIVSALEDLVGQEAAALANRDWTSVLALQERTAPLIDFLADQWTDCAGVPAVRNRIEALHTRRSQTSLAIAREIEATQHELEETQVVRRRVAQIAPAYGAAGTTSHLLQAVG